MNNENLSVIIAETKKKEHKIELYLLFRVERMQEIDLTQD